jgi:hypothetical protein
MLTTSWGTPGVTWMKSPAALTTSCASPSTKVCFTISWTMDSVTSKPSRLGAKATAPAGAAAAELFRAQPD